ncbi:putative gnk2-like domain-containing protein [Tanacetum coccineum]
MNTDIFKCRDTEKFQPKSGFEVNLALALRELPSTDTGNYLWYGKSAGNKPGEIVSATAMCPGYVTGYECLRCINTTIPLLRKKCPNQKEAVAYMQKCMLRYSGQQFLKTVDPWFWAFLGDKTKVPEKEELIFEKTRRDLMAQVAAEAAERKYNMGFGHIDSKTLYMVMQCNHDLSKDACNECFLPILFTMYNCCKGQVANAMLSPNCYLKYSLTDFRNL